MRYLSLILLIIFIIGCNKEIQDEIQGDNMNKLITKDDVEIAYNYFDSNSNKGIILLHMLSRNKETYNDFAKKLQNNGYKVISIDLRGHGKSSSDFKSFNSEDYLDMVLDVEEADKFLREKGAEKIAIIGASIGANVALNYAVQNNINTIVMLSPGEDYRSVTTLDKITRFRNPILIVAAEDDKYAFESSKKLNSLDGNSKFIQLNGNKHGTDMLNANLESEIFDWLNKNL